MDTSVIPHEEKQPTVGEIFLTMVASCIIVLIFILIFWPDEPNFTHEEAMSHVEACVEAARLDYPEYKDFELRYYDEYPTDSEIGFNRCHLAPVLCTFTEPIYRENTYIPGHTRCDEAKTLMFSLRKTIIKPGETVTLPQ
jgi:hypothetical protein